MESERRVCLHKIGHGQQPSVRLHHITVCQELNYKFTSDTTIQQYTAGLVLLPQQLMADVQRRFNGFMLTDSLQCHEAVIICPDEFANKLQLI